jgi:hypothetical protein
MADTVDNLIFGAVVTDRHWGFQTDTLAASKRCDNREDHSRDQIGYHGYHQGSAHETEKSVRLGLPRIIRLKENAPELDYSSFYGKTGTGDQLLCDGG